VKYNNCVEIKAAAGFEKSSVTATQKESDRIGDQARIAGEKKNGGGVPENENALDHPRQNILFQKSLLDADKLAI